MLASTANAIFWMSRYIERAESIARILGAASRMAAVPQVLEGEKTNEWESALAAAAQLEAFQETGSELTEDAVFNFLAFDESNPSSIRSCLNAARHNARSVRPALTNETWEAINSAYLEFPYIMQAGNTLRDQQQFLRWILDVSLRVNGTAFRNMLRDERYWFARLGFYIERADNTARILDVKYHVLLPEHSEVGGSLDYYQWSAILRSVSALTAYHWVYRQSLKPMLIADLLILREEMPRSLASCYQNITNFLDEIGRKYGKQGAAQRTARGTLARLRNTRTEDIFNVGLHEFLGDFIDDNNKLGAVINEQYNLL
ncbi:alpha-E domain-containing protein [Tepidamorphus sp. 3E244]|uniref:alpha-E domain-containing protein n=1 Tax=Tepidamorphus sp. 3E244 TaxID=3385498 RepID=UPI0038FCA701